MNTTDGLKKGSSVWCTKTLRNKYGDIRFTRDRAYKIEDILSKHRLVLLDDIDGNHTVTADTTDAWLQHFEEIINETPSGVNIRDVI